MEMNLYQVSVAIVLLAFTLWSPRAPRISKSRSLRSEPFVSEVATDNYGELTRFKAEKNHES